MKFNLGLSYCKYLVFLLNVLFVITSSLIMSIAIPTIIYSPRYHYMIQYGMQEFAIFWLVVGLISMTVALFGVIAAIRESTALANLYGVAMSLSYILQVTVMIASFTMMSKARLMVFNQLDDMMNHYLHYYRYEIDWIQSEFECCGNSGPHDWISIDSFGHDAVNITNPMPASCCLPLADYVNLACEKYHTSGCFDAIYQIVSKSLLLIGTFALLISILQILAISLGFMYAQIIRYKKSERDIRIWNGGHETVNPPDVDYSGTHQ